MISNVFVFFFLNNLNKLLKFYDRPNVCKTREEDVEDEETAGESKEVEVIEKDDSLIQAFHLNLETCAEKSNKYQCTKM